MLRPRGLLETADGGVLAFLSIWFREFDPEGQLAISSLNTGHSLLIHFKSGWRPSLKIKDDIFEVTLPRTPGIPILLVVAGHWEVFWRISHPVSEYDKLIPNFEEARIKRKASIALYSQRKKPERRLK